MNKQQVLTKLNAVKDTFPRVFLNLIGFSHKQVKMTWFLVVSSGAGPPRQKKMKKNKNPVETHIFVLTQPPYHPLAQIVLFRIT